jgi:hypothetical protein
VAISKLITVNYAHTLIEEQSLKVDLLNELFIIGKPSPYFIFHTPGLWFFQSVALNRGYLWPFLPGDQLPFLTIALAQTLG